MNAELMARMSGLKKSSLVDDVAKPLNVGLGDYARKSKDEIIGLIIANANEDQIAAAMDAAPVSEHHPAPKQNGGAGESLVEAIRAIAGASVDEDRVRAIVREVTLPAIQAAINGLPARRLEITGPDGKVRVIEGRQHNMFDKLLKVCGRRMNVWLSGPAGSGKTTAAENVAKALGLKFYFTGALDTEYKLLGFMDANGKVVATQFREAWVNGGVFLFDEIDGSLPGAILAFNGALANGVCPFPDITVPKHDDFICIAAANTWGHGATMEYVGRAKLDAASLDRFVKLAWDYDEGLERHLSGNPDWAGYVQKVRRNARAKGLKVVISPRASMFGAELLAAGFDRDDVCKMTMAAGLSAEQWASIQ